MTETFCVEIFQIAVQLQRRPFVALPLITGGSASHVEHFPRSSTRKFTITKNFGASRLRNEEVASLETSRAPHTCSGRLLQPE